MRALPVAILLAPTCAFAQTDLVVQSAAVTPLTIQVGATLTVSGNVADLGGTHIGAVELAVLLSSDATHDPGDTRIDTRTVIFAASTSPIAYAASFPMPPEPPGTYNVLVAIDPDGVVTETNETNNSAAAAGMLTYQGADLRVDSMTGPEYGFAGGTYRIELTIENVSSIPANDFRYAYYRSDTPQIRVFNDRLGVFGPVSVPPGGQLAVVDTVTLPTSTSSSYIGVILDEFGDVPDVSVGNNIGRIATEVRILEPSPDLSGRVIETSPAAAIGEQLAVTRSLANTGVAAATFDYAYYLSTDAVITTSDALVASRSISIDGGRDDYGIDLMNVPFSVAPGSYYVGLIVDPTDTTPEPNEMDNASLGPSISVYESAIRFTTLELPDATVGVPYEVGVYATGPLTVSFSVADGMFPPGLAIDPASGIISGIPSAAGLFELTIRAHSGSSYADRYFAILCLETTVPLEVVPIALPTGVVGRSYEAAFVAVGGQSPFTFQSPNAPVGLTLEGDGRLTGIPEAEGEHRITVEVEDAIGDAAIRDFTLRVITPSQVLSIVPINLPAAIIGEDYCRASAIQLQARDGVEPYNWSGDDLPAGMVLNAAGELCGTPAEVGSFPFLVRVHDQTGIFDSTTVILEVLSEETFAISTTTLPDANAGEPYAATLEVFRGERPFVFSIVAGAGDLPPGLALAGDGISGTPTAEGVFAFVVHVIDAKNRSDTQPLSIAVRGDAIAKTDPGGCGCSAHTSEGSRLAVLLLLSIVLRPVRLRRR
jgi:hypothetical protein